MQAKLTSQVKRLILKEKRKNPLLGCRKLSELLKSRYSLSLSKSLINKVLTSHGWQEKVGRKSELAILLKKTVDNCGLFFLKASHSDMCLGRLLRESIGLAFPRASEEKLEDLATFLIYHNFFEELRSSSQREKEKVLGIDKPISQRELDIFKHKFKEEKLYLLMRDNFVEGLQQVHCIKLIFQNNFSLYLDPEFRSLWGDRASLPEIFYLPLVKVREKLERIIKGEPLVIMGIPCFGGFPPSFLNFLKSLPRGLKSWEIIGRDGRVLEVKNLPSPDFNFIIGFPPQEIIIKGLTQRISDFSLLKIPGLEERVYAGYFKIKSSQVFDIKEIIKRIVLIKRDRKDPVSWGLLSNTNYPLQKLVETYSWFFPYLEKGFQRHLELVKYFSFRRFNPLEEGNLPFLNPLNFENFFPLLGEFFTSYFYNKYFLAKAKNLANWQEIFRLKGRVSKKSPGFIKIFLTLPSSLTLVREILPFLNESALSYKNRRLIFFA